MYRIKALKDFGDVKKGENKQMSYHISVFDKLKALNSFLVIFSLLYFLFRCCFFTIFKDKVIFKKFLLLDVASVITSLLVIKIFFSF